jgi:hypothetical protein
MLKNDLQSNVYLTESEGGGADCSTANTLATLRFSLMYVSGHTISLQEIGTNGESELKSKVTYNE